MRRVGRERRRMTRSGHMADDITRWHQPEFSWYVAREGLLTQIIEPVRETSYRSCDFVTGSVKFCWQGVVSEAPTSPGGRAHSLEH